MDCEGGKKSISTVNALGSDQCIHAVRFAVAFNANLHETILEKLCAMCKFREILASGDSLRTGDFNDRATPNAILIRLFLFLRDCCAL